MSTKPITTAEWATDADYPAGAEPEAGTPTKVDPTSGKVATGYRPDEVPTAQELNAQLNRAGAWTKWLDDGDVALHEVEVTGTLDVGGIATFGADVDVGDHRIRHPDRSRFRGLMDCDVISVNGGTYSHVHGQLGGTLDAGADVYFALPPLTEHERLKQVSISAAGTTGAGAKAEIVKYNSTFSPIAVTDGTGAHDSEIAVGSLAPVDLIVAAPEDAFRWGYALHITADGAQSLRLLAYEMITDVVAAP